MNTFLIIALATLGLNGIIFIFEIIDFLRSENNKQVGSHPKLPRGEIVSKTSVELITESGKKSITEELEEMAVNVCHNFCKHNNKGKCQWVLEGHICPLGKLY